MVFLSHLGSLMLLQSGGGWGCHIQDEYTRTSGSLVRTVNRLELLSLSLSFLGFLCMASLGCFYMMERPSCASAYQSLACIMLATLSLEKVCVGRAYTRL